MNLLSNLQPGSGHIAIAEVLTDMDVEKSAPEQRREQTHIFRQAVMQYLLKSRTSLI
jgi:hypothetical protein